MSDIMGHMIKQPPIFALSFSSIAINIYSILIILFLLHGTSTNIPHLWRYALKWLTIYDGITTVSGLIGNFLQIRFFYDTASSDGNETCDNGGTLCVVEAVTTVITQDITCQWTLAIGMLSFGVVWRDWNMNVISTQTKVMLQCLCLVPPAVVQLIALSFGVFGRDRSANGANWCFISSCKFKDDPIMRVLWSLLTMKLWELLAYPAIVNVLFLFVFKGLGLRRSNLPWSDISTSPMNSDGNISESSSTPLIRSDSSSTTTRAERAKQIKMFFWLPIAFVFIRVWGTIRFFVTTSASFSENSAQLAHLNSILLDLQKVFTHTQSMWNLILILIYHREARTALYNLFTCRPSRAGVEPNESTSNLHRSLHR